MDFRFQFDRRAPAPEVKAERRRREQQKVLIGRQLAYGLAIPSILVSGPLGGWLLGAWLDRLLGTQFVMILLVILGVVGGFWMVIDMLVRLSKTPG